MFRTLILIGILSFHKSVKLKGSAEDTTITTLLVGAYNWNSYLTLPLDIVQQWRYIQVSYSPTTPSGQPVPGMNCNVGTSKTDTATITSDVRIAIATQQSKWGIINVTIALTNN